MHLTNPFETLMAVCLSRLSCLVVIASASLCNASEVLPQRSPSDAPPAAGEMGMDLAEDRKLQLPQVIEGRFNLPALSAPSTSTDNVGRVPEGFREDSLQPLQMLPESASDRGLDWNWSVCTWHAANTFSHPRYFEDRMLERHGHERFSRVQPLASGFRFFATVPMLPYLMTVRDPWDCEYTLGYYRPGSCAPVMLQRPPYERRAVIAESAAIATAIIAVP